MTHFAHALSWAFAILALAVLTRLGVTRDDIAQLLSATVLILAVISINARGRCISRQGR